MKLSPILLLFVIFTSCTPEEYEPGEFFADVDGNKVILELHAYEYRNLFEDRVVSYYYTFLSLSTPSLWIEVTSQSSQHKSEHIYKSFIAKYSIKDPSGSAKTYEATGGDLKFTISNNRISGTFTATFSNPFDSSDQIVISNGIIEADVETSYDRKFK